MNPNEGHFERALASVRIGELDSIARDLWRALAAGLVSEAFAEKASERIAVLRRQDRRGWQSQGRRSYFPPKKAKPVPDRSRRLVLRRTKAATAPLPPKLASSFTTGGLAVLAMVSELVRDRGMCDASIPEIARKAGVGETLARNAIRDAERLGLLTVQERRRYKAPNLTNVVRVVCRHWLGHLRRRWSTFEKAICKQILNRGTDAKEPTIATVEPEKWLGNGAVGIQRPQSPAIADVTA